MGLKRIVRRPNSHIIKMLRKPTQDCFVSRSRWIGTGSKQGNSLHRELGMGNGEIGTLLGFSPL